MTEKNPGNTIRAEHIGTKKSQIPLEISTRFLEHFSEQLYSSPQKAFEELIANGWDAGADFVDIRIPEDLAAENATITVLDNGVSMDEDGLRGLWNIALSPKRNRRRQHGRPMVGKFGIGKLATYVLASRLTYICRAADNIIRRVTMDYGALNGSAEPERLVRDRQLDMFEVGDEDLREALQAVTDGNETLRIIDGEVEISRNEEEIDDDFGAEGSLLERSHKNTWTLVILSGLKPAGRALRARILRRMLRAALPLSAEMVIQMNGEVLTSTKADVEVLHEWRIGKPLGFDKLKIEENGSADSDLSDGEEKNTEQIPIESFCEPVPHVELPDVGRVTGVIRLYKDRISGGKSEERGVSNGFFVNVLGRIIWQSP